MTSEPRSYTYDLMGQTPLSPGVTIISQMITPALLILACGSLLAIVLARLGRVVDYVRQLGEKLDDNVAFDESHVRTLNRMEQRAELAEHSIQFFFIAVMLFVLTCLLIGGSQLLGPIFDTLSVVSAVLGVMSLLVGSGFMVAESGFAVAQAKADMKDIRAKIAETKVT